MEKESEPAAKHPKPQSTVYKQQTLPGAFSLFGPSWEAFKKNWVIFVFGIMVPICAILILVFMIELGVHFTSNANGDLVTNHASTILNIVSVTLGTLAVVLAFPLSSAMYYYAKLQSSKGVKLRYWATVRVGLHYFWRILALIFLRGLLVAGGLLLFVVPGLFLIKRYMMAPYILIDEDAGVIESMKKSAILTNVAPEAVWGIVGVNAVFMLLSMIPLLGYLTQAFFGIGYACATAVRYLQLKAVQN